MSSTQENNDKEFDLAKLVPKSFVLIAIVFMVGLALGYMLSPKPIEDTENKDDIIVGFMDNFIDQESFCHRLL